MLKRDGRGEDVDSKEEDEDWRESSHESEGE